MAEKLNWQIKLSNVMILAMPATMALFLGYLPETINLSLIG